MAVIERFDAYIERLASEILTFSSWPGRTPLTLDVTVANKFGLWQDDHAWFKVYEDEYGDVRSEAGILFVDKPSVPPRERLYVPEARPTAADVVKHFEDESSARFFEKLALAVWIVFMAVNVIARPTIGCGGDLELNKIAYWWFAPVMLVFLFIGLSFVPIIWALLRNRPDDVVPFFRFPRLLLVVSYRRAPAMFTVTILFFMLASYNTFLRYDVRDHVSGHYTRIHDRLFDTWRTYDWVDCPPADEDPQ
jgi:hypothetical protein